MNKFRINFYTNAFPSEPGYCFTSNIDTGDAIITRIDAMIYAVKKLRSFVKSHKNDLWCSIHDLDTGQETDRFKMKYLGLYVDDVEHWNMIRYFREWESRSIDASDKYRPYHDNPQEIVEMDKTLSITKNPNI